MHFVAHHLQKEAVKLNKTVSVESDAYARSSFNRYYYTVFLETRKLLAQLDSSWSNIAHKTVPEVLRGKISKELKRIRQKASKIGDADTVKACVRGLGAANGIAKVLEQANSVRIVADYEPEIAIKFSNSSRFSLNEVSVTEAHGWLAKIKPECDFVLAAWKLGNV